MDRKPITSSTIASAGHEGNVFEVEFTSGAVYQFTGMSKAVYEEFRCAESKGRYFMARIRANYPCARVYEKKEELDASKQEEKQEVSKTEQRKKARQAARKLRTG